MACIFVLFFKKVVGNLISQTKGLNGLFVSQRFGPVAKKEAFKIAVTIHFMKFSITATKVSILYQVCHMSFWDANE